MTEEKGTLSKGKAQDQYVFFFPDKKKFLWGFRSNDVCASVRVCVCVYVCGGQNPICDF